MATRKGKFKVKNGSGSYDQIMLETLLSQVIDSPIKTLERNAVCKVNTVYTEVTLPKGGFLICTQAGTTGASAATGFATAAEGASVTDGTAKFEVHYFSELASLKSVVLTINNTKPDNKGNINLQTGLNLLARNKAYAYGDIAYSPNLPSWAYLYCVQAGTTAASEPSFASVNTMGQYITDGTVKWIVDDVRFNIPVGVPFYDTYLHDGCVKLNGATVNRADYIRPAKIATDKSLWTSSPSTVPYKYGNGNGSTTMTLPDYRNRFIEGSDNVNIISAGLPNIKGTFQARAYQYTPSTSGAFTVSRNSSDANQNSGNASNNTYTFNASRSNAIYGGANTVQPASICLIPQIKF